MKKTNATVRTITRKGGVTMKGNKKAQFIVGQGELTERTWHGGRQGDLDGGTWHCESNTVGVTGQAENNGGDLFPP